MYVPAGKVKHKITIEELLVTISSDPIFLLGDMNCHLEETDYRFKYLLGKPLLLLNNDLVLFNDNSITHRPTNGSTPFAIDLAFFIFRFSCG